MFSCLVCTPFCLVEVHAAETMLTAERNHTCRFDGPKRPSSEDFNSDVHCMAQFAFCGYANCTLEDKLTSFGKPVALCGCAPYGGKAKNAEWDGGKARVW